MKYYLCIMAMFLCLCACKKEKEILLPPPEPDLLQRNIIDTAYGNDGLQKMDVYLPAKRTAATKTIVVIHGGGWTEGDKADLNEGVAGLQVQFPDYAIVNINYRLAKDGNKLFPAQENDIKQALQLYQDNVQQFHVSGDLIVIGFSAGAHLALLHSYKNDAARHVKAVVDFFGPTDLKALWNINIGYQLLLYNVTGKTYDQDQNIYNNSSPINFISAQTPPTIVLHGGADATVPPAQAEALVAELEKQHVIHQYVFYPTEGHGWTGANLIDSFNKIKAFVEANID